jgi:hypothetical protein
MGTLKAVRLDSNAELMELYRSSMSWPRHDRGDHVQAILNMTEAYLQEASNYPDNRFRTNTIHNLFRGISDMIETISRS